MCAYISQNRIAVFEFTINQHADGAGQQFYHSHAQDEIYQRFPRFIVGGQRHEPLHRSRVDSQLRDPSERRAYADGPKRIPQKRIRVHSKCTKKKKKNVSVTR